ncbi:MAG: hypothetical protein JHC33_13630 [Ignisphaera sp.]|nr:hypothetical protein [Ignisphaera sp.]
MIELKLANKLMDDLTGQEFDVVMTSGRGGLILAQLLAYHLNVPTVHVVTSVRTIFPSIQPSIRVLVVDDINDTGRTMGTITHKLRVMGVRKIVTAVLYERHSSIVKADYVGEMIDHDEWHKFSWDGQHA